MLGKVYNVNELLRDMVRDFFKFLFFSFFSFFCQLFESCVLHFFFPFFTWSNAGHYHVSAGDLLREEVARGSKDGAEIERLIQNGQLVRDLLCFFSFFLFFSLYVSPYQY